MEGIYEQDVFIALIHGKNMFKQAECVFFHPGPLSIYQTSDVDTDSHTLPDFKLLDS
jgi:hypothetical protein